MMLSVMTLYLAVLSIGIGVSIGDVSTAILDANGSPLLDADGQLMLEA